MPQPKDGEDEEPSLLADLRWSSRAHKDVLDNHLSYMKECEAQAAALEDVQQQDDCMDCDEDELTAEPRNNDTSSAAYMEAQRQMLAAQEQHSAHAPEVDPQLKEMLHTDVDCADDSTMHHHEAVRCVLDLVWQVEATSHLFSGTSVECGSPLSSLSHAQGPNSPLPCTGCPKLMPRASSGGTSS